MQNLHITAIHGREILDSRGNPTLEAQVTLSDGTAASAAAPSGASTGAFEAKEKRDGDPARYSGKGVLHAAASLESEFLPVLQTIDPLDQPAIDRAICTLDGTPDKSRLGSNATLAVSAAVARAAATAQNKALWQYLGESYHVKSPHILPVPMMNILNGGAHAANNLDVQEFMILPVGAPSFAEAVRWGSEIHHALAALLKREGLSAGVGDEGGFAPDLSGTEAALQALMQAISLAGYRPGEDVMLGMDAAASEWKSDAVGVYLQPKSGKRYTAAQLTEYWQTLAQEYPLLSLEDGLDEEDWSGWHTQMSVLGDRLQLVGDDLFVTHTARLKKGIQAHCANAILIKPNQVGTLTETAQAVQMAQTAGFGVILSHRSGETADPLIADLAVALNAGQIKTGAPCRSERCAKYNRLMEIETALGEKAEYPGRSAFPL